MGLFDLAISTAACPHCAHSQEWRVQFEYGFCRRHEYGTGDPICWLDPPGRSAPNDDHGENVGGLVRVPGFPENRCARCGLGEGAVVWLRNNVIERIEISCVAESAIPSASSVVVSRVGSWWPRTGS